jgi:hypothetical protein
MFLPDQVQRRGTDLRVRRQQLLRRKAIDISPRVKNLFCHLRLIDEDVPFFAVGPTADENTTRKLPLIRPTKLLAKQVDSASLVQPSTPVARDVCRGQNSTLARFGIQP